MQEKINWPIIALILVVFTITGYFLLLNNNTEVERSFETKTTGTTEDEDVEISLTPRYEGGVLKVDFSADTHTVSLGEHDLLEQAHLEVNGEKIQPKSAPSLGGHHVYGDLEFEVNSLDDNFKVVIEGIPNVEERTYEW